MSGDARAGRWRAAGGLLALGVVAVAAIALIPAALASPGPPRSAAVAAGPVVATPDATTPAQVTGDPARGRQLFLQSCASCHGPTGAGAAGGPSIVDAGAALADFVLRTGRMPLAAPTEPSRRKEPAFGDGDIAALVAFVAGLGRGPAIPNVVTAGADLSLGRDLYIANCASCHGATGAGGAVGGGFVAPSLGSADPLTVGEAVVSGPGPMPVFAFPQERLDALAAYVQELRYPASPGGLAVAEVGPVAEGFLAASVGIVTLLAVARWIARSPRTASQDDEADEAGADADAATATDR